jgi:serine/threonine protein kinase
LDPVTPSKRKGVPVETDGPTELHSGAPWENSDELAAAEPYVDDTPSVNPTTHFPIPKKPKAVITTGDLPPPAQAAQSPDDAYLEAGTMLGDYRVEGQIGEGGMGVVYAAVHPLIGKRAAVKVLKAELCRAAFNVERFIDEARIVNQIGHPNIVDVFAFGQTKDGRSYFVMEWLKGESLRMRAARGRLDLDEICDVIRPLARALEAAHEQGVIHRDLKPDNIYLIEMRGEAPRVKLLDFGIAKLAREEHRMERTATGAMVGTPQYIAPEQAKGYAIDARVDIYSLGGILFELLTGRPPFVADNAMEMVAKHLMEAVPRASTFADVPAELDDLVMRMLSKDPNGRPSLAEVAAVIERTSALDRTSVKTQLPRAQTPAPSRAQTPVPAPRAQTPMPAPSRAQSEPVMIPTPTPFSAPNLPALGGSAPALKPPPATPVRSSILDITDMAETIRSPGTPSKIGKRGILLVSLGVLAAAAAAYFVVALVQKKPVKTEPALAAPSVETTVEPIVEPAPPKVRVGAVVEPSPPAPATAPAPVTPTAPAPAAAESKLPVKVEPKPAPPKPKATPPKTVAKAAPPPPPKKPKLGRLELAITGGKGTPKIVIDGVVSSPAKDLPPGVHTIIVTAPGAKPTTVTVTIEEGKTQTKTVVLSEDKPKETPKPPPPPPARDDLLEPGSLNKK